MVYKKIGDKIPSLSSLLLAGMLLPTGCDECTKSKSEDPKDAHQEAGKGSGDEQDDPSKKGAASEGDSVKPLDKGFVEAISKFFKFFVEEVAMLTHLATRPFTVTENDLKGDGDKVAHSVGRLCKSFTDSDSVYGKAYPSSLNSCFAPLANLTFRTSGSMTGLQHKYAYGMALNTIAQCWADLHDVYVKMMQLARKGAPEGEMEELVKELDRLLVKVKPNDGSAAVFTPNYRFYDSKEPRLLDGDRLVRFLSDTDTSGQLKTGSSSFGMPAILAQPLQDPLWVMGKSQIDTSRQQNISNIATRGAGISNQWVVKSSKMVQIDPFPNSQKVTHIFDPNAAAPVSAVGQNDVSAPVQQNINLGQLLFTLFRGNQELDFMDLSAENSNSNKFKLVADNKKFQSLLAQARDMGVEGRQKFAEMLGKYVENPSTGLDQLFVIPDVDDIFNRVQSGINTSNNAAATQTANTRYTIPPQGQPLPAVDWDNIGSNSIAHKLLDNLAMGIFGGPGSNLQTSFTTCSTYANAPNFLASSANIEQKICGKVFQKLITPPTDVDTNGIPLIASTQAGTAEKLLNSIRSLIVAEAKAALVYKDGGVYVNTLASDEIQRNIKVMGEKLAKKHGNASITYGDISTATQNAFSIIQVNQELEHECKTIKAILQSKSKMDAVLRIKSGPGTVNYQLYFDDLPLMDAHTKGLDGIRLGYVKSEDKERAPGA